VLYALYLLGGDSKRVHTEDVAVKCFELFPGSFSWVRYPKCPDKDIVRIGLMDARKERYGARVEGRAGRKRGLSAKTKRRSVEDGWMLTTNGIAWIQENLTYLELIAGAGQVKDHRQKVLRQLKRIRNHAVFARYLEDPSGFAPMIGEIADLLRCRVDAEPDIWEDRFEKVRRQAESAGQADVSEFIDKCRNAYMEQR